MAYNCKIIADSINELGKRLTTFEITFPRIILAEFNTHRMFSRNSASSRAIPFRKQLEQVNTNPFIPERFPINGKGMQPTDYIYGNSDVYIEAKKQWLHARDSAVNEAEMLYYSLDKFADVEHVGVHIHKQIVNRLLEPFMWHTVIVTATEWDNFFSQRCSENAQYEIKRIADLMYTAYYKEPPAELRKEWELATGFNMSPQKFFDNYMKEILYIAPIKELKQGEWHLPYINEETVGDAYSRNVIITDSGNRDRETREDLKKISVARCARVSYLNQDSKRDIQSDLDLYNRLVKGNHWSPFEHVATPLITMNGKFTNQDTNKYDSKYHLAFNNAKDKNFIGWKQFRSYFPNENVTGFKK